MRSTNLLTYLLTYLHLVFLVQLAELIVITDQKLSVCLSVCVLTRVAQVITAIRGNL